MEQYAQLLQLYSQTCAYCRQIGQDFHHPGKSCPYRGSLWDRRNKAVPGKGRDWLPQYVVCFWCLNMQQVCRRRGNRNGVCDYPDVVLPACLGVWSSPLAGTFLRDHFHFHPETEAEFVDWLGGCCSFGGAASINAVRVTAALLRKWHDDGLAAVDSSPLADPSIYAVSHRRRALTPKDDDAWLF